jgi:hypothetical protein
MDTQTAPATTTALTVWTQVESDKVTAMINAGQSVPKALYALAPKGFVATLRKARSASLSKNSAFLVSQLTEQGFRLSAMSPVKELKNGTKTISMTMKAAPTRKLTAEEVTDVFGDNAITRLAKQLGMPVEQVLSALGDKPAMKPTAPAPTPADKLAADLAK